MNIMSNQEFQKAILSEFNELNHHLARIQACLESNSRKPTVSPLERQNAQEYQSAQNHHAKIDITHFKRESNSKFKKER